MLNVLCFGEGLGLLGKKLVKPTFLTFPGGEVHVELPAFESPLTEAIIMARITTPRRVYGVADAQECS